MVPTSATVTYRLFASGYCLSPECVVDPARGRGNSRFYATWLLIEHSVCGLYLFDTGYAPRFYEATRRFPEKLYAWATPVFIEEAQTAVRQLLDSGITPGDISGLIISHFHADHVAGMLDFPKVPIICHADALAQTLALNRLNAVRKGVLKTLLPSDVAQRTEILPAARFRTSSSVPIAFTALFGDGTVELAHLPGHARGQLGVRLHTPDHTLFFATDAAWRKSSLAGDILPNPVVKLLFDDWAAYKNTFAALRTYQSLFPEHKMLFTHCPETMKYVL